MPDTLRRFLRRYNAHVFLFDAMLAYAIYTAFFELQGLSYVQIGLLLGFWSGSALLLEVATGALSDWGDRRVLMVAAPLIKALTFVAWALADGNFWLYGLGFLFWSIGSALYSGTREALLYEQLDHHGAADDFDRHYGRAAAAESLGVGAGLLLGGLVAAASMPATMWLSIPPLLVCAAIGLTLPDLRRAGVADDDADDVQLWGHFGAAWSEFRDHPQIRFVTLYIALGLILFEELEEFDQLYYLAVSLPIWLFGVAGAVGLAADAALSDNASRLAGRSALAWLLPGLAGLLMMVAALGNSPWFVVILESAYLVAVPAAILAEAKFQSLLTTRSRATATSMLSFFQNVAAIIIALIFGGLAQVIGILPAYGWAGVALLLVALWVWSAARRGLRAF